MSCSRIRSWRPSPRQYSFLKVPPDFNRLSTEKLYEEYGAPELEPIVHFDREPLPPGVPSHGIAPLWLGEASEDIPLAEARLLLSDFGEAFSSSRELKYESYTPLAIRLPEARFEPTKPLSFSSNIWSLACFIWAIIAQRPLFESFLATQDDMTCEHVDALGILPPEWWEKWEARQRRFSEDGTPINRNPFQSWRIVSRTVSRSPEESVGCHLLTRKNKMLSLQCYDRCSHLDQRIDPLLSKFSSLNGW